MKEYIAFISYRHREPDQTVAIRLHRRIEHFRIPADLDPESRKTPGKVFRDEDELPLSADLGESIRYALANSEYLIAICTPEYPKSRWCMEELNSFIAMNGRERVLAVLAEGTPEESFPPQLLHIRDAEGNEKAVEPLAANITAPSRQKSLRRLKTEKLRIIASLLGCSYDTLYQREKRYRQRRILRRVLVASALALAVAAVFIGTLLRKNEQIQNQYEETRKNLLQAQLNESVSLTENARNDLQSGRRIRAIRTLLQAIPEDPDQPYDVSAEGVLTDALRIYSDQGFCFSSAVEQDTAIKTWTLSGNGDTVFTWDDFGVIRAWKTSNGQMRWQCDTVGPLPLRSGNPLIWCEEAQGILCVSDSGITMLSASDGKEMWNTDGSITGWNPITAVPGSGTGKILLIGEERNSELILIRADAGTGEEQGRETVKITMRTRDNAQSVISASGRYAGILERSEIRGQSWWDLILIDTESLQARFIALAQDDGGLYCEARLDFTRDGQAAVSVARKTGSKATVHLRLFDPATGNEIMSAEAGGYVADTPMIQSGLACSEQYALVSVNSSLYAFSLTNRETEPQAVSMPGNALDIVMPSRFEQSNLFCCVFENGLLSFINCEEESFTVASEWGLYGFDTGFSLHAAWIDPGTLILTAIPAQRLNELLIIRLENSEQEKTEAQASYTDCFFSPSGKKAYLDNVFGAFAVFSVPEDRFTAEFSSYRTEDYPHFTAAKPAVFTSDEEHIIRDRYIISLQDGTAEPLPLTENSGRVTVSAWIPSLGKAVTVFPEEDDRAGYFTGTSFRLLLDGTTDLGMFSLPEGTAMNTQVTEKGNIRTLGGNGLLLISTVPETEDPDRSDLLVFSTPDLSWQPVSGKIPISSTAAAAAANRSNWFALADRGRLSLYQPDSETPVWETDMPFATESISGLWPSPDDRLLMVTYGAKRVAVYRTADGKLLNDLAFDMASDCVPRIRQDTDGRLYFSQSGYSVSAYCLVLDPETGSLIFRMPKPVFINLHTRKVYYTYAESGIKSMVRYPLYFKEELREIAKKKIGQ